MAGQQAGVPSAALPCSPLCLFSAPPIEPPFLLNLEHSGRPPRPCFLLDFPPDTPLDLPPPLYPCLPPSPVVRSICVPSHLGITTLPPHHSCRPPQRTHCSSPLIEPSSLRFPGLILDTSAPRTQVTCSPPAHPTCIGPLPRPVVQQARRGPCMNPAAALSLCKRA